MDFIFYDQRHMSGWHRIDYTLNKEELFLLETDDPVRPGVPSSMKLAILAL